VFLLRAAEQMSVQETADRLGIQEETVRSRYHRARHLLREVLGKDSYLLLLDRFPFAGARCRRLTESVLAGLRQAAILPRL
jgi:RNA polymerase sigma-70 factor, ECF subfamily